VIHFRAITDVYIYIYIYISAYVRVLYEPIRSSLVDSIPNDEHGVVDVVDRIAASRAVIDAATVSLKERNRLSVEECHVLKVKSISGAHAFISLRRPTGDLILKLELSDFVESIIFSLVSFRLLAYFFKLIRNGNIHELFFARCLV